jgi:tetratricopeptide (TPR) repeat protein
MNSINDNTLKEQLLALSEEVVDLSDKLQHADSQKDERLRHESSERLRHLGGVLLEVSAQAQGDDLAFAQFVTGSVCSLLGYWQRAEESYRAALDRWPDHVGILNELFDALVVLKKYEEALVVLRRSMRHGGETPLLMRNHASVLVHLGRTAEARLELIKATARYPEDRECRSWLAMIESLEGGNS